MIKTLFVIWCQTGCTCCGYDNHYRGPYKTKEDAEKRIACWKKESIKAPIMSQYAKKRRYSIEEITVENISKGRAIIDSERVVAQKQVEPIIVDSEGRIEGNDWLSYE